MSDSKTSVLYQAAIASGLLSEVQLDEAILGLTSSEQGAWRSAGEVSDHELAERLVNLGYLNRWQAEQLREGHTKFKLGPYRIVDAIGKGGMGHVFKGEHELLGRIEAVKVLPTSKSTPDAVASFHREIRVQAQLDHPNLVRVSFADHEGETHFFVTEYVPGTDLRRLVRRHGPLPVSIASSVLIQVARGLQYAHSRGLVHRDIKPSNILVTPQGLAKLTDLGLAWYLVDDIGTVTTEKPESIVGTADYLAPEAIAEPAQIRAISDIYSLGCTLYYAITGKVPFPGGRTSDKMRRHLHETPLNPLHFNPDLPQEFCNLIAELMEKKTKNRTPSAEKVVELLLPWCAEDIAGHFSEIAIPLPVQWESSDDSEKPIPPGLAETAVIELDPDLSDRTDASNIRSARTKPLAAAMEDTLKHEKSTAPQIIDDPNSPVPFWLRIAIMLAVCGVIAVLWAVIDHLF